MMSHSSRGLFNYIDDLIYSGLPSEIQNSYQFLLDLLQELGLDINHKKLLSPATSVTCLGILVELVNRTLSIPNQKLQEIIKICENGFTRLIVVRMIYSHCLGHFFT